MGNRGLLRLGLAILICSASVLADDGAAIRAELEVLKARIAELESRLEAQEEAAATEPDSTTTSTATDTDAEAEGIALGGAVRLNYFWQDYNDRRKGKEGDFDMELFRLDADGELGGVTLSAQYRWYNDFEAVHHAWFGFDLNDRWDLQLGINQVPFGIMPYASHSYWFGATYYMGFEDDYDNGLKFSYQSEDESWNAQLAFYKNAEYTNSARYGRYSFDVASGEGRDNEEVNQVNARVARSIAHAEDWTTTFGASVQYGQLYNGATDDKGDHHALALHADSHLGPWNFQGQVIDYQYDPANPPGISDDTILMSGFAFPFEMTTDAHVASLNFARSFDVEWGPVTNITCYNDHSRVFPQLARQDDSIQNVTGCLVTAGGLYTYIDWIVGRNMWFAGGPGIGLEGEDDWRSRLNVNIGFYF